jgi:integrative and conjugative element protein (TIGR02256 family)
MRDPLIFANPFKRGAFVLVEPSVLDSVLAQRQQGPMDPEAGGILLGMRRGEHIHVTQLTSPGPEDRRSRTTFHRARRSHQEHALKLWHESGGLMDYLGEWHTHPEIGPNPSAIDLREWCMLLRNYEAALVFLIGGTGQQFWLGLGNGTRVQMADALNTTESSHG